MTAYNPTLTLTLTYNYKVTYYTTNLANRLIDNSIWSQKNKKKQLPVFVLYKFIKIVRNSMSVRRVPGSIPDL